MCKSANLTHILNNTRCGDSLNLGGRPCVSSSAVIPKLQISAAESYCRPWINSGAIQQGYGYVIVVSYTQWASSLHTVPTKDFRFPMGGLDVSGEASLNTTARLALLLPNSEADEDLDWERSDVVEWDLLARLDDCMCEVSSARLAATPRSPRSTVPSSSMRRFAALTSRCINPLMCR